MAGKKKFEAPQGNPYGSAIQSAESQTRSTTKTEYYRFNMKMPMECKDYLQEMAWQHRTTITQYLNDLVLADMAKHPEWKDGLDELNK